LLVGLFALGRPRAEYRRVTDEYHPS
jgi:hypothetical protein